MKKAKQPLKGLPPMTVSAPSLIVNDADDAFRSLVDSLILFATQIQNVRQALSNELGVTQPQYNILMKLAHQESQQSMSVKELAERLNVTPSFIVVETNKLLARGLLSKQTNATDRRLINVQLTDAAINAVMKLGPFQRYVNDALFGELTKTDFKFLSQTMKKLVGRYEPTLREIDKFRSRR